MSLVQVVEATSKPTFALGPSFLDQQTTKDGRPYGPIRFKQIVKELYIIGKQTHTPYTELLNITPTERDLLLNLIIEENKKSEEAMEKIKAESMKKRQGRGR